MKLNTQILYVHENFDKININDILNIKDNNAKTYIINYITKNKKNNTEIIKDKKEKKIVVKKVVVKKKIES